MKTYLKNKKLIKKDFWKAYIWPYEPSSEQTDGAQKIIKAG